MGKFELFIVMFFASLAVTYASVIFDGILAHLLGIQVEVYGFNIGPKLFQRQFGRGTIRVNWIPMGSYTRYKMRASEDPATELSLVEVEPGVYAVPPGEYLDEQPRWKRAVLIVGSQLIILAMGILIVGQRAIETMQNLFPWLGQTLVAPKTQGANLVAGYFADVQAHGIIHGIGIMAINFSLINLLPFGSMRGWQFILQLLSPAGKPAVNGKSSSIRNLMGCIGLLVTLAVVVVIWTAIISYLMNPAL